MQATTFGETFGEGCWRLGHRSCRASFFVQLAIPAGSVCTMICSLGIMFDETDAWDCASSVCDPDFFVLLWP